MKKFLFIMLAVFAMTVFTGCEVEEDEEPAQALTEFIVGGYWDYTEVDYSNPTHVSTIEFEGYFYKDGTYELWVGDGNQSVQFNGTYTIDDGENTLTISNPFYVEGENDEFQLFTVEWQEGIDEMYWSDPNEVGGEVMKWTRSWSD